MSYLAKDLSVLAYANGFILWHYKTDDDAAAATGKGYFNLASDMLRAGDKIEVQGEIDVYGKSLLVVATDPSAQTVTTAPWG